MLKYIPTLVRLSPSIVNPDIVTLSASIVIKFPVYPSPIIKVDSFPAPWRTILLFIINFSL